MLYGAVAWLPWALTAPLILAAGRRYDFRQGHRLASVAAHLPLFLLCYAPSTAGLMFIATWLFGSGDRQMTTADILAQVFAGTRMQLGVIVYAAILGLGLAVRTWQALRERELEASRLEAQTARARLEALSARLQPHFLFNTLHAIAVLIDEDPARARSMIALLGDLLRDVISGSSEGEVPLRSELELLQRYLAIEQVRFADRLRVEINANPATLECPVPRLLLQPLAENALRHGLAPRAARGTLWISSRLEDDALILEVSNDGLPLSGLWGDGVGLSTTRERLETRRPAGTLTLEQQGAQVVARIVLPARAGEPA
jgi:LytS/YehU family sensor histidine kinase